MNIRRLASLGLLAVAGTVLATGCNTQPVPAGAGGTASAAPSASAPAAKDVLARAVAGLGTAKYALTITIGPQKATGTVDGPAHSAQINLTATAEGITFTYDAVAVGSDVWVRLDLGAATNRQLGIAPARWMHVDVAKVTKPDALPLNVASADLLGIGGITQAFAGLVRTDATHLTGTVDLTRITGQLAPSADDLAKVKDKVGAVPVAVTLDAQGRLTELKIDAAAIDPALTHDLTFNYDAPHPITKPTGAVEAPAKVYAFLNA